MEARQLKRDLLGRMLRVGEYEIIHQMTFSTSRDYYKDHLTAAVLTHSMPTQDQASQNSSIGGGGTPRPHHWHTCN